jgi:hypothetical protein
MNMIDATQTAPSITAADDPIFAAIDAHRSLRAIYSEWCDGDTPEAAQYREADAAAWGALFTVRPASIAGVKALTGHFREIAEGWADDTQFLIAIETACEHLARASLRT